MILRLYIGVFSVDDPTCDVGENEVWCEFLNTWQYYFNRGEFASLFDVNNFQQISYNENVVTVIEWTDVEREEWAEVSKGVELNFVKKLQL